MLVHFFKSWAFSLNGWRVDTVEAGEEIQLPADLAAAAESCGVAEITAEYVPQEAAPPETKPAAPEVLKEDGAEVGFADPRELEKLDGIGPKRRKMLEKIGVTRLRDIAACEFDTSLRRDVIDVDGVDEDMLDEWIEELKA